jgi:branched-chain amino acid transport system substrate-binding protein
MSHVTAALTLSLTGRFERQGTEAAEGVRLWAETSGVQLTLADDRGSKAVAIKAYSGWIGGVDLLLGPYASGLVRAVVPLARDRGQLLWNHGGSADDLAQPGVVCLAAPASSYFEQDVDLAVDRQVDRVIVVQGPGPFARAVTDGARARASAQGIKVEVVDASALGANDLAGVAVLVAGSFEHAAAIVGELRHCRQSRGVLGAVAAGIPAFGRELAEAAEGVVGPVQWWPDDHTPTIGPSGADFVAEYQRRTGREPSYPAAQAAAAGYLTHAAHRQGLGPTACGSRRPQRCLATSPWTLPGGRSVIA